MPDRPRIVCLCGSTRFMSDFHFANMRETLAGRIVLSVGVSMSSIYRPTPEEKIALDELHKRKIDLAAEVLVINPSTWLCPKCGKPLQLYLRDVSVCDACRWKGKATIFGPYIGDSTRSEIAYAVAHGKPVRYLTPPTEMK